MMTATARKMSFESKHLRFCDYFALIPSCSHFTMLERTPSTELVCALLNQIEGIKDLQL